MVLCLVFDGERDTRGEISVAEWIRSPGLLTCFALKGGSRFVLAWITCVGSIWFCTSCLRVTMPAREYCSVAGVDTLVDGALGDRHQ